MINAHDTGERPTWIGDIAGFNFEITKHKLVDDRASKAQPPAPRIAHGGFFTALFNGQDKQSRFKGAGGDCAAPPPPPGGGDDDDDDGETG